MDSLFQRNFPINCVGYYLIIDMSMHACNDNNILWVGHIMRAIVDWLSMGGVHWIRFWHGMRDWIIEMFVHVHAVRNRCELKPVLKFVTIKADV